MIKAYNGETVKLEVEVLNTSGEAADLTGGARKVCDVVTRFHTD